MPNENLLATYSLLSFIRESYGEDSEESLLAVFVPLVKAALVRRRLIAGRDTCERITKAIN